MLKFKIQSLKCSTCCRQNRETPTSPYATSAPLRAFHWKMSLHAVEDTTPNAGIEVMEPHFDRVKRQIHVFIELRESREGTAWQSPPEAEKNLLKHLRRLVETVTHFVLWAQRGRTSSGALQMGQTGWWEGATYPPLAKQASHWCEGWCK